MKNKFELKGHGFAFPVPEEIKASDRNVILQESPQKNIEVPLSEILKTSFSAVRRAWEEAIQPRIAGIREQGIAHKKPGKFGADFFTDADTESEQLIREIFTEAFGTDILRIYGEEEGETGKGNISIRIDPVDGTQAMKFGKRNWGVMIGVYEMKDGEEQQIAGTVFLPELNSLFYYMEGAGTFLHDTTSQETLHVGEVSRQDELDEIMIHYWEDADVIKRGDIPRIKEVLYSRGAVLRQSDSSAADALEALLSDGRRAMIFDTASGPEDLVAFSILERTGYKIFDWEGNELRADDLSTAGPKLVIVPPGKASQEILEAVKNTV